MTREELIDVLDELIYTDWVVRNGQVIDRRDGIELALAELEGREK